VSDDDPSRHHGSISQNGQRAAARFLDAMLAIKAERGPPVE
jgi:hypothetical protein